MNGPHDMGGMQCYGPVLPEPDEPVFHHDWEKRALAVTVAMGATGMWNLDMARSARESLDPVQYLSSSYYQIWLAALENLMLARGMVSRDELESGRMHNSPTAPPMVPDARAMRDALMRGTPVERETNTPARFSTGEKVRTANINPATHTRLPRYVRDKVGLIETVIGCHVFPDSNAIGSGEDPHWLYTVRFEARYLFGGMASHFVHVDCWEPYLEAC